VRQGIYVTARTPASSTRLLNEVASKQMLEAYGIATTTARLVSSRDEAVAAAREIGFPVVLKVVSSEIVHKSDAGGVKLGLTDADQVGVAYDEIMGTARQLGAVMDGVSVQRMAPPGVEVVVGMNTDPQFGPVLMFGLGGVLVELLKDVSFRLVPLERADAREMIEEIKGNALLEGFRGAKAVDKEKLVELLLQVSRFVEAHPEVVELDLNPVFAYPDGALAVDARVVVSDKD
jgi:acyl-CoA synthetase (NDP forming)